MGLAGTHVGAGALIHRVHSMIRRSARRTQDPCVTGVTGPTRPGGAVYGGAVDSNVVGQFAQQS
jgi:hypothetical protein